MLGSNKHRRNTRQTRQLLFPHDLNVKLLFVKRVTANFEIISQNLFETPSKTKKNLQEWPIAWPRFKTNTFTKHFQNIAIKNHSLVTYPHLPCPDNEILLKILGSCSFHTVCWQCERICKESSRCQGNARELCENLMCRKGAGTAVRLTGHVVAYILSFAFSRSC